MRNFREVHRGRMHTYLASEEGRVGRAARHKVERISQPLGKLLWDLLRCYPDGLRRAEAIRCLGWQTHHFERALLHAESHGYYLSEYGGRYYAVDPRGGAE